MEITVSSRQGPVSVALRAATIEKVSRLSRYLEGMERAEVHFDAERNRRISAREVCEITLHGHGHHVRAKVAAPDVFAAVDIAVDKLEHQLHKLKSKLVTRQHGRRPAPSSADGDIPPPATEHADSGGAPGREAKVVKTKRFAMKPMTPDEAVLQMELLDHRFFLFTNATTGLASVVYRRDDGDIGLIEAAS